MTQNIFWGANVLLAVLAFCFLVLVLGRWRKTREEVERIRWLEGELERALQQIESTEEDEILAGCQTLAMINDPRVRARALDRIRELMNNANHRIAKQASFTYEKILTSFSGAAGRF